MNAVLNDDGGWTYGVIIIYARIIKWLHSIAVELVMVETVACSLSKFNVAEFKQCKNCLKTITYHSGLLHKK